MCDKTITAVGGGVIMAVDKSDPCSPVVQVKHAAGCPEFTGCAYSRWLADNPWFPALIYIAIGTLLAFKGRSMFPLASSVMLGLFLSKLLLFLTYELYYEGDDNYHWPAITICIVIGVLGGLIVKRFVYLGIFFVALACGWSIGSFLYGIALSF